MMVWRLYVKGECVGTYGDGLAAMSLALRDMSKWINAGYSAEDCDIRHEEYTKGDVNYDD